MLFLLLCVCLHVMCIVFILPNCEQVKMGRSNDEGDLHKMNKSQQMIRPEKRGGIYRFANDSIKVIGLFFFFSLLFLGVCVCRVLVFIDVDRGEGEDSSSLHLASFQGPDNEEILSRIDLLKKNAVSFSSGNQPQRDEAQQQPSLLFSSSRMVTMSPPTTPGTSRNGH